MEHYVELDVSLKLTATALLIGWERLGAKACSFRSRSDRSIHQVKRDGCRVDRTRNGSNVDVAVDQDE